MTIIDMVELVSAAALVVGLVFAIIQLRQFRHAREREATLELVRSFETPEFAVALRAVYNLPAGLPKSEIEKQLGDKMDLVYSLMTTWESLGILVYRREVSMDLVDDFFSGPIMVSWVKLEQYIKQERQEQRRETIEEWFQWLAERMKERESASPPVPAYAAHRGWRQGRRG